MPQLSDVEYRLFQALMDKQAIQDVIVGISRAIDRGDEALLRKSYWDDAHLESGYLNGSFQEFAPWVLDFLGKSNSTGMHTVCSSKIELDGDDAYAESYFMAGSQRVGEDERCAATLSCGRLLDHFSRRNGEWRVAERYWVYEWGGEFPGASSWSAPPMSQTLHRGKRSHDDLIYKLRDMVESTRKRD